MPSNIFEHIYKTKFWQNIQGTESGPGSSIECSKPYLDFVQQYCVENNVKSILDLGCGDFELMRHFNFDGIVYHGVDIVEYVVNNNTTKYGQPNITFQYASIVDYVATQPYDLVLCKDVLQHLPQRDIISILNILANNTCLVTNDCEIVVNQDIQAGDYSPIDLSKHPYCVHGEYVYEWQSCTFYKKVYKFQKLTDNAKS